MMTTTSELQPRVFWVGALAWSATSDLTLEVAEQVRTVLTIRA